MTIFGLIKACVVQANSQFLTLKTSLIFNQLMPSSSQVLHIFVFVEQGAVVAATAPLFAHD